MFRIFFKNIVSFLMLWALGASAQYNFAGLAWGESVAVVREKMSRAGYKISYFQSFGCQVDSDICSVDFSGPSVPDGKLVFRNSALSAVSIETRDFDGTLQILTQKYGRPSQRIRDKTPSASLYTGDGYAIWFWPDIGGSSLSISESGKVLYSFTAPKNRSGQNNF